MFNVPFESDGLQFTESLNVDSKLQLTCEDIVSEIRQQIKLVNDSNLEKLQNVREFPTPAVLSRLSWKAYEDGEKECLPDGWQLLTTACNKHIANGYFGAAFLHPENLHVVVSHRGTELNNLGAVVADLAGIVFNNCGGQMESACTFADKVVQSIKTIETENEDKRFEIFFTGHSLGGWLAQVTGFSTTFLKRYDQTFVRLSVDETEPYHAQTTVFDSPGCLPMLQKLKSKFEKFRDENSQAMTLSNLSVTSYLSAPNQVNTCNEHFGRVYRVFINTTKMNFMDRNLGYTLNMHSIVNIVSFFEKQNDKVQEVLEWPTREGITNAQELENFLKHADHRDNFHFDDKSKKLQIRYKTQAFDECSYPLNVFTSREQQFLEYFRWIRQLPEFEVLKNYIKDANLSDEVLELLKNFDIVKGNLTMKDPEKLKAFIPHVKLLLKLHPNLAEKIKEAMADQKLRGKVFAYETKMCLNQVTNELLEFNPSIVDLNVMSEKQFLQVRTKPGKTRFGVSMVHQSFEKSQMKENYSESSILVLDLKRFSIINQLIDIKSFLEAANENFLLILFCENSKKPENLSMDNLFNSMKGHGRLKVILVGESGEAFDSFGNKAEASLGENFKEIEKDFTWGDLTEASKEKLLSQLIGFQGFHANLKNFFSLHEGLEIEDAVLMEILSDKLEVNHKPLALNGFSAFAADLNKKEIDRKILFESLTNSGDIFVISGLHDRNFNDALSALKVILNPEDGNQHNLIEINLALDDESSKKLRLVPLVGRDRCRKEFYKICRESYAKDFKNLIHWVKVKDGKLLWRKSFNPESCVERNLLKNSKEVDEFEDKFAIVVGKDGDGKSTFMTQYSKEKLKTSWLVHLKLNEVSFDGFKDWSHDNLRNFVMKAMKLDSDNLLQKFLLNHLLTKDTVKPIQFVFDGFDDILIDNYRSKTFKLLKFINDETNSRILLATRDATPLSELQPSLYNFAKINFDEREKLLKQFWLTRFSLIWGPKKCSEIFSDNKKSKFKVFAKLLLDQLEKSMDEKAETLMGVPQQLSLLAEGFQEDFDKFVHLNTMKQKIIEGLKLKIFYQHYVSSKYELYVNTKAQTASLDQKRENLVKAMQNVSIDALVPQEAKDLLSNQSEHFSADFVILQLTKGQSPPKVLSILTGYLLTDPKCGHIRVSLNAHPEFLPRAAAFEISDDIVNGVLGQPMITVCKEGHAEILEFLIEVLKKKNGLKGVVLGVDDTNRTALDYAIENCHEACIKTLIEFLFHFGDLKKLLEVLQRSNKESLNSFFNNCENSEFATWFHEFLIDNKIQLND